MYWEQNTVRCEGVLYQLPIQLKSAGSWKELRQLFRGQTDGADGKTLRQPTFREIVALVLSAKNERQNPQAERVMQEFKKRQYLTGDTLVLWPPSIFLQPIEPLIFLSQILLSKLIPSISMAVSH